MTKETPVIWGKMFVKIYTVTKCMYFVILKGTTGSPGDPGYNGTKVKYIAKTLQSIKVTSNDFIQGGSR